MRLLVIVLFTALCLSRPANAAVVFSIQDVVVSVGEQAAVGVFVTGSAGQQLSAFTLPIEIGGDNYGLPSGWEWPATRVQTIDSLSSNVSVSADGPPPSGFDKNFEAAFSDSTTAPITLTTTPRHLFNILVDATGITGPDPVSITSGSLLLAGAPFGQSLLSVTIDDVEYFAETPGILEFQAGSIQAVPEPTSFALLGLAGLGGYAWRRRRATEKQPTEALAA